MKSIFITRDLDKDSILHTLSDKNYVVSGCSLIDFSVIPITGLPFADWIFFYSKNGVKFFHQSVIKAGLQLNSRIACIGKGTADQFYRTFNHAPEFIGSGDPSQVALQFKKVIPESDKILFITAEDSNHSISKELKNNYEVSSIAAYSNTEKKNIVDPEADIIIFTSPKNADTYLNKFSFFYSTQIIAIGKITAQYLHTRGVEEVVISVKASEEDVLQAIKILEIK